MLCWWRTREGCRIAVESPVNRAEDVRLVRVGVTVSVGRGAALNFGGNGANGKKGRTDRRHIGVPSSRNYEFWGA